MTIERSRGKARPTLPRSSDLRPVERPEGRNRNRDAKGRFGAGNAASKGRGWKRAIAGALQARGAELGELAATIAADAQRLFKANLAQLPDDGPMVRARLRSMVLHEALEAYYASEALRLMGTPEGRSAEERAGYHAQRAERLSVTTLDVATRMAAARPKSTTPWWDALHVPVDDDEPDDDPEARGEADDDGRVLDPATGQHGASPDEDET